MFTVVLSPIQFEEKESRSRSIKIYFKLITYELCSNINNRSITISIFIIDMLR